MSLAQGRFCCQVSYEETEFPSCFRSRDGGYRIVAWNYLLSETNELAKCDTTITNKHPHRAPPSNLTRPPVRKRKKTERDPAPHWRRVVETLAKKEEPWTYRCGAWGGGDGLQKDSFKTAKWLPIIYGNEARAHPKGLCLSHSFTKGASIYT